MVAAKGGKDTSAIPGASSVTELEAEVARLRKALAQANIERDIIKKAAVDSTCQRNTLFNNFFGCFKFQGLSRPAV